MYGLIWGLVFYPMSLTWMDVVVRQYGNVDPLTSAAILALVGLAGGLICAVLTWGVALASRKGSAFTCALAAVLWVALEYGRAHLPIFAFPWNLIGYAAGENLALVQLTALTGIYGLSLMVAGFGALLAWAILSGRHRAWQAVIVASGLLALVALGGPHLVPFAPARQAAHLVQTNFAQSEEYPQNWLQLHSGELDELQAISIGAASQSPGLIVWPEVPAPFSLQDPAFAQRAMQIPRDSGSDLLIGVEDWKKSPAGTWEASNTAVLLDPSGRRLFTYDKIHLVPFGEYVPLRKWLTFTGKITADIGDFTSGTQYTVGKIPGGTFGVYICYEAVFPEVARRFTKGGAQLLINVSNDGWFGRSAAPAQHLMMARVRAVENRRWLLRDTNNGYTASIDPYGRVAAIMPSDVRGEMNAPYDFRTDFTPYTRFGDWLAWLCVMASIALLGMAVRSLSSSGSQRS
jgi:apolipoprotein N-acyltransferase